MLESSSISYVTESQKLLKRAKAGMAACPAFWLRGLTPIRWTKDAVDRFDAPQHKSVFGILARPKQTLHLFGHASGGDRTGEPRLRTVSHGFVAFTTQSQGGIVFAEGVPASMVDSVSRVDSMLRAEGRSVHAILWGGGSADFEGPRQIVGRG